MNVDERLDKIERKLDDIENAVENLTGLIVHINEKVLDSLQMEEKQKTIEKKILSQIAWGKYVNIEKPIKTARPNSK